MYFLDCKKYKSYPHLPIYIDIYHSNPADRAGLDKILMGENFD